jgi:hypothetical protein
MTSIQMGAGQLHHFCKRGNCVRATPHPFQEKQRFVEILYVLCGLVYNLWVCGLFQNLWKELNVWYDMRVLEEKRTVSRKAGGK